MEPSTTPQTDTPAPAPQAPPDTQPTPAKEPAASPSEPSQAPQPEPAQAEPTQVAAEPPAAEEEEVINYQSPTPVPPIDFSQLPVDENNLVDPNALAGMINQRISQAEQNALNQAQRIYAENEQEKRLWEKTYEKYPDLKNNKELQGLVQQARIGEATDLLSKAANAQEAAQMKLPTPAQIAEKLFKHIGTAKTEGMQQANTNTVVQKSAYLEPSGKPNDNAAESVQAARSNINNPNREVREKARNELLQKYLGWDQ